MAFNVSMLFLITTATPATPLIIHFTHNTYWYNVGGYPETGGGGGGGGVTRENRLFLPEIGLHMSLPQGPM